MPFSLDSVTSGSNVLLFGSQALSFDEQAAHHLHTQIQCNTKHGWLQNAIRELPELWKAFTTTHSLPGCSATSQMFADLEMWLETGRFVTATFPLPNTLLIPLAVVSQLVEFGGWIESQLQQPAPHGISIGPSRSYAETFGLCTGLLAAVAVSCSRSDQEIEQYGAVAIRLAMLIGAIADAQGTADMSEAPSRSFSVAWTCPQSSTSLEKVLSDFPEAHLSVKMDDNRAMITTPSDVTTDLQQQLTAAGFVITALSLRGRFHSKRHTNDLDLLTKFCRSEPSLQFRSISDLVVPLRTDTRGQIVRVGDGELSDIVAHSILTEQANWHASFDALTTSALNSTSSLLFCVGSKCYIPRVASQRLGSRVVYAGTMHRKIYDPLDNAVAVIGMACKVPGANDLEEFWRLLCEPKSQHVSVSEEKFGLDTSSRTRDRQRWYGNFLDQCDSFDHKFFQKSPREMAASDPQHRLMLQVAYQAVEQSGYFNHEQKSKHIGCYIGIANADYERNIACYPANAYSATGNLKSFTSGKINHHFGWTGPSLTIDTACSASTVAVHCACKAILSNECTSALAGGVNVMTSPDWFLNLAGASFLSPTGQCKPFDSKADGYCRAEGVGAVFLKKLSAAVNDGDQIIGVIRGSAVYQNGNCTGITVPSAPSLFNLFTDVIQQAGLYATQISVVEAHAAGTAVGDPIEYDSIRRVCGGPLRTDTLFVGSSKAVIGHAECASGVISLIKTLLMIRNQTITPQIGLQKLNPALCYSPDDRIEITTEKRSWKSNFRAAMVNNFGASGSNACLIVTEPPHHSQSTKHQALSHQSKPDQYPFMFCGATKHSLQAYVSRFLSTVNAYDNPTVRSIQNLSFQVARQSNRTLQNALILSCSSGDELEQKLLDFDKGGESLSTVTRQPAKPVIMCFGGQSSTVIGLSQHIYDNTAILRRHLDECDRVCKSMGLAGLYPHIFQQVPIDDTVLLQTALFSIQYACAKSWMDCGVEVAAVVGLSFGELTALCISGALSLYQAIELVTGRAEIIQRCWGSEKGSMMAVEGNIQDVHRLLLRCDRVHRENPAVCIACFNGPRNFTLAGSSKAIEAALSIAKDDASLLSLRCKKLNVTHAFHSALTDPLMADLFRSGSDFPLNKPTIHFERATEAESEMPSDCSFLAEHMRQPAFYNNAVQRLVKRYPSAIWLEAGTNSSIANLTSRALESPTDSLFQSVNLSNDGAIQSLTDATMNLWRHGVNCSFWLHHTLQTSEYYPMLLPPYQFENHRHWMELIKPASIHQQLNNMAEETSHRMWTFLGYGGADRRSARFLINTSSQKYLDLVLGHKVAQSAPICSSTVQLELAVDTLMSLRPEFSDLNYRPEVHHMENLSPIVLDLTRSFWLNAEAVDDQQLVWHWAIVSATDDSAPSTHVTGEIRFRHAHNSLLAADFARYGRLVSHQTCRQLLESNDVDEVMQGQGIYRSFTDILVYGKMYKGLRKIVGKGSESAGRVSKAWTGETWIDSGLLDSFCQVAGIYVNNMTDRGDDEMYISTGIEQFLRSPQYYDNDMRSDHWEVYANNHRISAKEFVSDVFVFDARTGVLAEIIIGIKYTKVSRTGLGKMVLRLTNGSASISMHPDGTTTARQRATPPPSPPSTGVPTPQPVSPAAPTALEMEKAQGLSQSSEGLTREIYGRVKNILVSLSGLEADEIGISSVLEDVGFDSLMNMELAREVEKEFGCAFCVNCLVDVTTVSQLVEYLQTR